MALNDNDESTCSAAEAARRLGEGVSLEDVYGRIRRGSLAAEQDESGSWRVSLVSLNQILANVEQCESCSNSATSYIIVKYHHHERIEFELCDVCAKKAQVAYGRRGGVLEVVTYPLLGEGWKLR